MSMPQQKPGSSKQDYGTPDELLKAIKHKLYIQNFDVDVAASKDNRVCEYYYDEAVNGLEQSWSVPEPESGWAWCNPPYADIESWVTKAIVEAAKGAQVVMLAPASVGSNWYCLKAAPFCYTVFLQGRLTFKGCKDPYIKDCMLLFFTPWGFTGKEVWSWREA